MLEVHADLDEQFEIVVQRAIAALDQHTVPQAALGPWVRIGADQADERRAFQEAAAQTQRSIRGESVIRDPSKSPRAPAGTPGVLNDPAAGIVVEADDE